MLTSRIRRSLIAASALTAAAVLAATSLARAEADPDPVFPHTAVGVSGDHERVLFFDPETCEISGEATSGYVLDAAAVPARKTLYLSVATQEGPVIRSMRLGGGPTADVVPGSSPAVSGNGRVLAYSYTTDAADGGSQDGIAVRDLDTGAERRFPSRPGEQRGEIDDLSVSRDGGLIAFSRFGEDIIFLLDTRSDAGLVDADPVVLGTPYDFYRHHSFLADGRLVAIRHTGTDEVVAINPATQEYEVLVDDYRRIWHLHSLAVDSSGKDLLINGTDREDGYRFLQLRGLFDRSGVTTGHRMGWVECPSAIAW